MAAADPFNPIPNPKISTYYQTKAAHTAVVTENFLDKLGGGEYKSLSYTHIKGGTSVVKKRGQGKAKGINAGDGEKQVEIYDGKIITPKSTQEITILFHQQLNGVWTTFTKYPYSELETLYAQYRAQRFKHKQPDEEVKKAFVESMEHRYSDWIFHIRNSIFQKYKEKEDRYRNGPSFILTHFWKKMIDKWMEGDWGDISLINKRNRNKSEIFSTTGSVPMAKYRYEMDGTSRDEKDNSNNNKEVENSLELEYIEDIDSGSLELRRTIEVESVLRGSFEE